jgi:hypothetical protein
MCDVFSTVEALRLNVIDVAVPPLGTVAEGTFPVEDQFQTTGWVAVSVKVALCAPVSEYAPGTGSKLRTTGASGSTHQHGPH